MTHEHDPDGPRLNPDMVAPEVLEQDKKFKDENEAMIANNTRLAEEQIAVSHQRMLAFQGEQAAKVKKANDAANKALEALRAGKPLTDEPI